jgi:hypothetical protein
MTRAALAREDHAARLRYEALGSPDGFGRV